MSGTTGTPAYADWRAVLASQDGVITRQQALDGGLTPRQWDVRAAGSCGWVSVTPGVCVAGPVGLTQRARAAVLAAGPHAVLSGLAVLVLAGLRLEPPRRLLVLVPEKDHVEHSRLARVVRVLHFPEPHPVRRFPQVRASRAAVDAATYEASTAQQARFFLMRVVQDGLATPAQLRDELRRRQRLRHGGAIRDHVDELVHGVRSLRERELLRALRRRGTRPPDRLQATVDAAGRRYLDAWWQLERVACEVQGPQHFDPDVTGGELLRMSALAVRRDRVVVQVPSWLLPAAAGPFLQLLDEALAAGRQRAV